MRLPTNYQKHIVYLSEAQKEELFETGSVTVGGVTVTYNENDLYVTPQAVPYVKPLRGIPASDLAPGTLHNIPYGGASGLILKKASDADYDVEWGQAPMATDEQVAEAVTEWLDDNVPSGTTLVADRTLTIDGAAAEAKTTGDALALKADADDVTALEEAVAAVDEKTASDILYDEETSIKDEIDSVEETLESVQTTANNAILKTAQNLTAAEKTQARTNIGAVSNSEITDVVRVSEQSLTDPQQEQARTNIGIHDDEIEQETLSLGNGITAKFTKLGRVCTIDLTGQLTSAVAQWAHMGIIPEAYTPYTDSYFITGSGKGIAIHPNRIIQAGDALSAGEWIVVSFTYITEVEEAYIIPQRIERETDLNDVFKVTAHSYTFPSDIQPNYTATLTATELNVVPVDGYRLVGPIRWDIGHKGLALTGSSANGSGAVYFTLTNRLSSVAGYNTRFAVELLWCKSEMLT